MKTVYIIASCISIFLCSCEEGSYIKHELTGTKKGACADENTAVKMESNINGERYVFEECLPEDFDGKAYDVVRRNDSLFVTFPQKQAGKTALFTLTLDIQANPVYKCIQLGGREPIHIKTITKF